MTMTEGSFVWYELVTSDPAAAAFYADVVGWTMQDMGQPDMPYTIASIGTRPVGGIMGFPPEMQVQRAAWRGYVLAADVDAMAERVKEAGGTVHREPMDIPDVGRFAVVSDPQGAVFMLFRGDGTPPPDLPLHTPGTIAWHELHARDWEQAFPFYQGLFGWRKADAVDMGPMGTYQLFSTGAEPVGGMMSAPQAPLPGWLYYIMVDDIDAAAARIAQAGGTISNGPHPVPGGGWIVQAADPQGVAFALTGPRLAAE